MRFERYINKRLNLFNESGEKKTISSTLLLVFSLFTDILVTDFFIIIIQMKKSLLFSFQLEYIGLNHISIQFPLDKYLLSPYFNTIHFFGNDFDYEAVSQFSTGRP